MKRIILKTLLGLIVKVEYRIFKLTGIQLPILKLKWRADSINIQRMINSQGITVYCPKIKLD